ncbi:MAG: sodium/solute symporter [Clostridiaceae bacterium]|nr:sodium/solute symporter [Clostridiaceae bacterium]
MKYLIVCLFIGMLLYVGWSNMRKARTVNDFFLGGRSIGPWLSAFSYGTAYFSAVILIGYAGSVGWGFGLSGLWIVLGNTLVGSLLAWYVLAKRTRAMTARLHTMTMPEFLEARYDSRGFKMFSALVIFIFLVPYSASVYMGLSYLFNQVFGIPYIYVAFAMCLLTALYLVLGGYRAVAMVDVFQGSIMIFGIVMFLYYIIGAPQVGGLVNGIKGLAEVDPGLVQVVGPPGWLPLLSLVILTSLGTWGLPQMVQKFYAIKNEESIRPAAIVATIFAFIITFGAYFSGIMTPLFFDNLPVDVAGQPTTDLLMPTLIGSVLPELGAAIILLLVLSASMSTLASLVLVSSSAISIDLLKTVSPAAAEKYGIVMMRVTCAVFIALSLILALSRPAIILSMMAISWGTVAGVFLAPYLYGLYWKGTTRAGALAGSVTDLVVSLGFSLYFGLDPAVIPIVGSIAMVLPLLVVPAISLVTQKLPDGVVEKAFGEKLQKRQLVTVLKSKGVEN